MRHVREERGLRLAGLVGLHDAPLAREEIRGADGEQQHEHGEHPDDEARDGEQAAVERRRRHEADDLPVHALEVGHEDDIFLLVIERGGWRAVEPRAQLAQHAAELHAVDVAAVGLRPVAAAHRHGAAGQHEQHAPRAVEAFDVEFFCELRLRVVAVEHIADVFAVENGNGQEQAFALRVADGGVALERLADAVPLADFQRVADDGAATVREHAHALDAHAVDVALFEQAFPRVRALDADEVLHAHELRAEARVDAVREHVDVHGDFLLDVRVEHRADALLQHDADDDEQHEEQRGKEDHRGPAVFECFS